MQWWKFKMPRPKRGGSDWVTVYTFEQGYETLKEPIEKALRKAHIVFKTVYDKARDMYDLVVKSVDFDRAYKVVRKAIDEATKEEVKWYG